MSADSTKRHRPRLKAAQVTTPDDPTDRRIRAAEALAERGATDGERAAAVEAVKETHQRPPHEPGAPSPEPDIRFTNVRKPPSQPSPHLVDILAGSRIQLERTCDRLRLCCRQGCIAVLDLEDLLPGDVPTYAPRCDKCDRHLGYLHHQVSDQIRHWLEAGRASVPILRDSKLLR